MKFMSNKLSLCLWFTGTLITASFLSLTGTLAHPITAIGSTIAAVTNDLYDVVVIGSEIQGVLLAKEAQAAGLKVLILDPRPKPGGELIQGQMFFLDDVHDNHRRSLVQGEIKNLFTKYKAGTIRKAPDFQRYYDHLIKDIPIQSGIVIDTLNTFTIDQDKSLKFMNYHLPNGSSYRIRSKYWVENTDFGALTGRLESRRIPGMETLYKKKQTEPDYMAATYMLNLQKVHWHSLQKAILSAYPLTNVYEKYGSNTYANSHFATGLGKIMRHYTPQDKQLMLRGLNITNQKDGEVTINGLLIYDVNPSDLRSVQSAIAKAQAEAPHILNFFRSHVPGFIHAELNDLPEYLYIRDYNRYETEYVLEYPDLMGNRMFWDNVSLGGYPVDIQGSRSIPWGIGYGKPDRYGLPLRSFELKSYDNVLVVGKNVGATIKAYGSARIMPTTALAAQTIGIILGRERDKLLCDLNEADFERIHKYLEKEYQITLR
ncbi:FAD-dependent oxidoreductase [Paenibacillus wynnii]|uniref:FAD-dependent oxidoreductase n=1 Tax=Paenibacillus wynnii TaxID=268407 RepID=UPI000A47CC00|nr:FAD-dependent oxidoreductase [Paenibacillus wynnii]